MWYPVHPDDLSKIYLTVEIEKTQEVFHTERNECLDCCKTIIKFWREKSKDDSLSLMPERNNV